MEGKFTEIWIQDKESILDSMRRNIIADLDAGYDPTGDSIRKQTGEMSYYKAEFEAQLEMFKFWEPKKVNNWCYWDLKKRGAIA